MPVDDKWLPKCLQHLNEPYVANTDDSVVIAERSDADVGGYPGHRELHTALVPHERLDEVLSAPGNIGWTVSASGPMPYPSENEACETEFWIEGPRGQGDRLEPIVVSWQHHNKIVMMPDNGLLMCYGLSPRVQKNPDRILWDDLSKPEYDVVTVTPLSHYDMPRETGAEVRMNLRYLQDYACLKRCAIIAVFYEERRCCTDDSIEAVLQGKESVHLAFPGCNLDIIRDRDGGGEMIRCRIWGRRLVLESSTCPITDGQHLELEWPGYLGVMTDARAMAASPIDYVYVSDQIIERFEGKPEFQINPLSGHVSYDGWWSLSYCHRVARDYIAYEIKKIYEGCPQSVIQHVHRFAIHRERAQTQERELGNQNIGIRAASLIEAYLSLGDALAALSDGLEFSFDADDLIGLSRADVEYHGWWTIEGLKPLGYRAPLDMTRERFLERCMSVYQLFEGIKEKSLRRLIERIGVPSDQIKDFRSFKLFATLLQLRAVSKGSGLDIVKQSKAVAERWDKDLRLEELCPLFALVDLRIAAGHKLGVDEERLKVRTALNVYGLDEDAMTSGWGRAVDQVYDMLTRSLNNLRTW